MGLDKEVKSLCDSIPPKNSKERRVEEMFVSVVPMSWRRQVRKYVSAKLGLSQLGNTCLRIAWPGLNVRFRYLFSWCYLIRGY
jgi:hypothetical protein